MAMGLEVMVSPDSTDHTGADFLGASHAPATPVSFRNGLGFQSGFHYRRDLLLLIVRLAASARRNLPHPVQTFLPEAFPPEAGRVSAYSKLLSNLQVLFAFRRQKNDSRPQGNLLGCGLRALQLFKLNSVYVR